MTLAAALAAGCGTPVSNGPVTGDGAVGGGGNGCNALCATQARAGCASFQMGTCVSECQAQYTRTPGCRAQFDLAVSCGAGATYTCSASTGRPSTSSCFAEGLTALQCASPVDAGS